MGVGFRLSGRTLELTGPWSPTAGRAVRLLRPSGLDVNYTRGFDGDDLDFLGDLAGTTIRGCRWSTTSSRTCHRCCGSRRSSST
jgi:hypothetical protein